MKKTLLTLALSAFAATAFAGTVYNYDSATSEAKLNLDTALTFDYTTVKDLYRMTDAVKETTDLVYSDAKATVKDRFVPGAVFGINALAKDKATGFEVGFSGSLDYAYNYEKTHNYNAATEKTDAAIEAVRKDGKRVPNDLRFKDTNHLTAHPYVDYAFVTFGNDTMGHFALGKTDSVVEVLDPYNKTLSDAAYLNYGLTEQTTTDLFGTKNVTARYFTPDFAGFSFGLSFGKNQLDKYVFTNQAAVVAKFNAYGADVALSGYKNLYKADHHSQSVAKGVYLKAGYSVADTTLTFGAGYETQHTKQVPAVTADFTQKRSAYSVGLQAEYNGFQYAQPYAGVYFSSLKSRSYERDVKSKLKDLTFVLGVQSDLYKNNDTVVTYYLEGASTREKVSATVYTKEGSFPGFKSVEKTFGLSTGLSVNF